MIRNQTNKKRFYLTESQITKLFGTLLLEFNAEKQENKNRDFMIDIEVWENNKTLYNKLNKNI